MMRSGLSRRRFVGGIGALGALLTVTNGAAPPIRAGGVAHELVDRLIRLLPHRESAEVLGKTVLATKADVPGAAGLLGRLTQGESAAIVRLARLCDGDLRRHVAAQTREDFRTGRIIVVDGWRISQTEAALAALVARRAGRSGTVGEI